MLSARVSSKASFVTVLGRARSSDWVAAKELTLSYYSKETPFLVYTQNLVSLSKFLNTNPVEDVGFHLFQARLIGRRGILQIPEAFSYPQSI